MAALIRSLHTAVPPVVLEQEVVRDVLVAQPGLNRLGQRLVPAAFNASGIERRHTVVEEWRDAGRGASGQIGTTVAAGEKYAVLARLPGNWPGDLT